MKKIDTIIKTKRTDFLGMWKDFWSPETQAISEEEEILLDKSISEEEKKELLKALKSTDKLSNTLFRESYKVSTLQRKKLKDDAKLSIEQSKQRKQKASEKSQNNVKEDSQREIID